MPRIIEKTVYKFDELSEPAKERARDWWRGLIDSDDFECVIEDAVRMGELLGIEFKTRPVKLMGGGTRHDPCVYWSLSYSQGDGAVFEGTYHYRPGALQALMDEAPATWTDRETGEVRENKSNQKLHRIAKALQDAQRPYFYKLYAVVEQRGRYFSPSVDVYYSDDEYRTVMTEGDIVGALRDFCDWIYDQLREQNDWLTSDEQVDDAIVCNDYEFYENGDKL